MDRKLTKKHDSLPKISLKSGNELIDLMKENAIYNQVFKIEEANRLEKIEKTTEKIEKATEKIEKKLEKLKNRPNVNDEIQDSDTQFLSAYTRTRESHFIGRKQEVNDIHAFLTESKSVLLINAIGGIGKTTLAKFYLQTYQHEYDHIIWVNVLPDRNKAGGDVMAAFVSYQNAILHHLELKFEPKTTDEEKFHVLMARLGKIEGNNLLVIDNAGEKIIEVQEYLPKSPRWKILVTSRNTFSHFEVYNLNLLPKEDAQALFLQYYPKGKDDSSLPFLLKRIGYHTLTIELLAKTLHSHKGLNLPKLWEAIDKEGLKAANRKKVTINHPFFKVPIKANDCVLKLFALDFLTEAQRLLLLQFAVLPPFALEYSILLDLLQISSDEEDDFMELLDELTQKGWLTIKDSTYTCHQIIQEVIRQQIPPTVEKCNSLIQSLIAKLYLDQAKDNPIDKFPWVPYGKSLIQWIQVAKDAPPPDCRSRLEFGSCASRFRGLSRSQRAIESSSGK